MVTAYALSHLADRGVTVFFCDRTHTPNAQLLPFASHSRGLKRLEEHLAFSLPNQKQVWRSIVIQKILNQALALEYQQSDEYPDCIDQLRTIASTVLSGDTSNREGYAAQRYFPTQFGQTFTRDQDIVLNGLLNYGYAIVRGIIARSLVAHGFLVEKGVHHKNEFNSYNLADDFIEPLRPVVDFYIKNKMNNLYIKRVSYRDERALLYDIINYQIQIDGKVTTISTAAEVMVRSFVRVVRERDVTLLRLPALLELSRHSYE